MLPRAIALHCWFWSDFIRKWPQKCMFLDWLKNMYEMTLFFLEFDEKTFSGWTDAFCNIPKSRADCIATESIFPKPLLCLRWDPSHLTNLLRRWVGLSTAVVSNWSWYLELKCPNVHSAMNLIWRWSVGFFFRLSSVFFVPFYDWTLFVFKQKLSKKPPICLPFSFKSMWGLIAWSLVISLM